MNRDRGSVTAEFALLFPAVIGVFLVLIQLLALQVERVQLAQVAGVAARAASHLMPYREAQKLVKQISSDVDLEISHDAEVVCATVTKAGLMKLQETICTRMQGL